jgi:NarL family two-component system sensor histidine kinase LiaS
VQAPVDIVAAPSSGRSLRRRLTLSYTAVTVAALLVVEAAVLLVLFGALALPGNGDLAPERLSEALSSGYVAPLALFYAGPSPNQEGLQRWLDQLESTRIAVPIRGGIPILFDPGEIQFAATSVDGALLAATSQAFEVGLTARDAAAPPRAPAYRREGGRVASALPIVGSEGRTVGSLLVSAVDVTPAQILGQIGTLLAVSALVFLLIAALAGSIFGSLASRGLARRLEVLVGTVGRWSRGELDLRLGDLGRDELGSLGARLDEMAERLEALMTRRSELAAAEERQRLARDLHDSVKQQAFAAAAQLAAARERPGSASSTYIEEAARIVDEMRRELSGMIGSGPNNLDGRELIPALEGHIDAWSRRSGVALDLELGSVPRLPSALARALYRGAQGVLANVERHSGASRVRIALAATEGEVSLLIRDDGVGFDPAARPAGFGLHALRERVAAQGGRLELTSAIGRGTSVTLRLPLLPSEDAP